MREKKNQYLNNNYLKNTQTFHFPLSFIQVIKIKNEKFCEFSFMSSIYRELFVSKDCKLKKSFMKLNFINQKIHLAEYNFIID